MKKQEKEGSDESPMKELDLLPEYKDWTIQPCHTKSDHWYRVQSPSGVDEVFPSVTTILKIIDRSGPLVGWAKRVSLEKVRATLLEWVEPDGFAHLYNNRDVDLLIEEARQRPDQVRDEAAAEGTDAHSLIDAILRGQEPEIPESLRPAVDGAMQFIQDMGLTPVASEVSVWHPRMHYAGTVDLVAQDADGCWVVVDWKRSRNGPYKEAAYQVSAYACAIWEIYGAFISTAYVVRLPTEADGAYVCKKVQNIGDSIQPFLNALELWRGTRSEPWEVWRES